MMMLSYFQRFSLTNRRLFLLLCSAAVVTVGIWMVFPPVQNPTIMISETSTKTGMSEANDVKMTQITQPVDTPTMLEMSIQDSIVKSKLEETTLKVLLQNAEIFAPNNSNPCAYVPPSHNATGVVESISSVLVASALSNAGNFTTFLDSSPSFWTSLGGSGGGGTSANFWQFFNSWFPVASSVGFMPRYSYPIQIDEINNTFSSDDDGNDDDHGEDNDDDDGNNNENGDDEASYYIPNTKIPNWPLFIPKGQNASSICNKEEGPCWIGSGRISAMPFHATFLLSLVRKVETTRNISPTTVHRLYLYWERVYSYHRYIHENVMRGCSYNGTSGDSRPCYNILHPWESLLDDNSLTLQDALQPALERINTTNWTVPFPIPDQVQESYDYNATSYKAFIYLAECLANHTTRTRTSTTATNGYTVMKKHTDDPTRNHYYPYTFEPQHAAAYEDELVRHCPFAMLDVGYAAVLAQADDDLYDMAAWLRYQMTIGHKKIGYRHASVKSWNAKLKRISEWKVQTKHVFHLLWNKEEQSYLSLYGIPDETKKYPLMHHSKHPVSNNLMFFWKKWDDAASSSSSSSSSSTVTSSSPQSGHDRGLDMHPHLQEMAFQMLRHSGPYSFDCRGSPIWSAGCDHPSLSIVDPRINYFVGLGLVRNRGTVAAFGDYLTNASVGLICNRKHNDDDEYCAANATCFQEVYSPTSSENIISPHPPYIPSSLSSLDRCETNSSATAAIFYHLLADDLDFSFNAPLPPIRNSWVITLITTELLIAFGVGVACVIMSLSIVRREHHAAAAAAAASMTEGGGTNDLDNDNDGEESERYLPLDASEDESYADPLTEVMGME